MDISAVLVDPSVKTGVTVAITGTQERMLITFPGAMAAMTGQEVDTAALYEARHLHTGSFYLQEGLRPSVPLLLRQAVERGLTTSLDPGHDPRQAWDGLEEALPWVDLFLANEEEAVHIAARLSGTGARLLDSRSAGTVLARRVRRLAVVKRGAHGALLALPGGRVIESSPFEVDVADTTGAGDAFDAGFVSQFLKGASLEDCLEFANACGAVATTYLGGTPGFPAADGILAFIRQHGRSRHPS